MTMNETAVQVSNPTTQGDINQAVSLVVQDKLEKAGITDQTLSELKSELQTLSEIDIVDEASFKLVHGGTMKATSARTTITKICKAGREYAIAEQKARIAAERENIASFSAQEAALKAKKEAWIAQKERVEREALEAQERVIRARFTALEGFGFTRRTAMDGGEDLYTNSDTTLAVAYVTAATDEVWVNVLKGIEFQLVNRLPQRHPGDRVDGPVAELQACVHEAGLIEHLLLCTAVQLDEEVLLHLVITQSCCVIKLYEHVVDDQVRHLEIVSSTHLNGHVTNEVLDHCLGVIEGHLFEGADLLVEACPERGLAGAQALALVEYEELTM